VDCADKGQPDAGGERRRGFVPSVHVADDGVVAVTYYDFRSSDAAAGVPTDYWAAHCHANCSSAASWTEETHIAGPFDMEKAPDTERGEFLGDYAGLASVGNAFTRPWTRATSTSPGWCRGPRPAPKPAPGARRSLGAGYSSCCSRRTSAHCSTPTTSVLPFSLCADEPRLRKPPDDSSRRPHSNRRKWPSFRPAPTLLASDTSRHLG
jgi:hypothetical protein